MAVAPKVWVDKFPDRGPPNDPRTPPSRIGERTWVICLLVGGILVATYFGISGVAKNILYDAIRISAGLALFVVVRRLAPSRARAWWLFGAGEVMFGLGDVVWDILQAFGREPFPSAADALYLLGYALIILGILRLIRLSTGRELPALVDAAIAATGVGLVLWVAVLSAASRASMSGVLDQIVSFSYPVMDLFLLVVAARLAFSQERRSPTVPLLLAGVVSLIASDVAFSLAQAGTGYETGSLADLGWLTTAVCWTAAVVHPSMAGLGDQAERADAGLSTRRIAMLVAASLLGPVVIATREPAPGGSDIAVAVFGAVLLLLIWVRFAGLVREHLHERAQEHDALLRRAGQAERHRIARELHDFVTFSLGAIILQSGGARRLLAADSAHVDEALGALQTIEERSRGALEEMRTLLTVLRRDGSAEGEEPAEDAPASEASGPEGLSLLVTHARNAGLDVELTLEGDLDSLPRAVALSAFRIVQEALNNACRHAPGSRARVVVRRVGPELAVEVVDDGGDQDANRSDGRADGRADGWADGRADGSGSGYGLVGMRERTAILNGHIEAGPSDNGGWAVRARLPVSGH